MSTVKETMSALQRHNDAMLRGSGEVEKAKLRLKELETEGQRRRLSLTDHEKKSKLLKMTLHSVETELKTVEDHVEKISAKLLEVSNQKEYEAGESERKKAEDEKGKLEEDILLKMDELADLEEKIKTENETFQIFESEMKTESAKLQERIDRFATSVKEHEAEFSLGLEELPQKHRSRFKKLCSSKDGVAVAEINGSACSGCNFSIPSVDLNTIRSGEVISCTNCGRFLFEKLSIQ